MDSLRSFLYPFKKFNPLADPPDDGDGHAVADQSVTGGFADAWNKRPVIGEALQELALDGGEAAKAMPLAARLRRSFVRCFVIVPFLFKSSRIAQSGSCLLRSRCTSHSARIG